MSYQLDTSLQDEPATDDANTLKLVYVTTNVICDGVFTLCLIILIVLLLIKRRFRSLPMAI